MSSERHGHVARRDQINAGNLWLHIKGQRGVALPLDKEPGRARIKGRIAGAVGDFLSKKDGRFSQVIGYSH
jgi:hypothetical protein